MRHDDPEALAALVADVLEVSRTLADGEIDREAAYEALFERLGEDPTVLHAEGAGKDGRINFPNAFTDARGTGLFRPDPAAMHTEPGREPIAEHDPAIDGLVRTADDEVSATITLPDGGHGVLMAGGTPHEASDYAEAGIHAVRFDAAGAASPLRLLLFKGTPGEAFDFGSAVPYTIDGAFVREAVAENEDEGEGMEVAP